MAKIVSIILGGGRGQRLYPLTAKRAKPAVPFGGKFRLVDIPISNCIHAGLREIYILTQFNSASLHRHVNNTYRFDTFDKGFVEVLAAEQTLKSSDWYQGTADAVRKNFVHFADHAPTHYLVLSGDQLYRMDLMEMFRAHVASGADVTIAAKPVTRDKAAGLGILQIDTSYRITQFVEKPKPEEDISALTIPARIRAREELDIRGDAWLASMGIYIFSAAAMETAVDNSFADFGSQIIPSVISSMKVCASIFDDYWEDIGTVRNFYEANIGLAAINPDFNLYLENAPIFSNRRDLAPSKINYSTISTSLASEGSIITNANISNSIVGIRTIIESGANLDGVVCMGADYYETQDDREENEGAGRPNIGIGRSCIIKRAIIDKNARIGENCRIGIDAIPRPDGDYEQYSIRDGIVVITKDGVLPAGTVI
ncbi:MAG TPA: glucose-1-phosphate adenylyltransferase [Spirochaetia bacterium]|nr:glucose-1-phosphate adenylyltransferase [Spirochaetia bacterium]